LLLVSLGPVVGRACAPALLVTVQNVL